MLFLSACTQDIAFELESQVTGGDVQEVQPKKVVHGKTVIESFEAKVIAITDGDSIKVLNGNNETIRVRLESVSYTHLTLPTNREV